MAEAQARFVQCAETLCHGGIHSKRFSADAGQEGGAKRNQVFLRGSFNTAWDKGLGFKNI